MLTPLEKNCIDRFRKGQEFADAGGESSWIDFGLRLLLETGAIVRDMRLTATAAAVRFKDDGSPWTQQERQIEALAQGRLASFCPDATFVGEESGGELPPKGLALAMDPVDGTWSLVNHAETCTNTLAVFRDGKVFVGMIQNPVTGEVAYASEGNGARLIQLSLFGEPDRACDLPRERVRAESVLVNLQPQRNAADAARDLFAAWQDGAVNMMKLTGGSPSWSLLEAAKGSFAYVNLWTAKPSDPFDLAAGVLLVREAGGEVTSLDGIPIDAATHSGPFIATMDVTTRDKLAGIIRRLSD
jgi:fructose-1,6-bisphosphatase/inositol monophosphatase family enzyme